MIKVTNKAKEQIKDLIACNDLGEEPFVRIAVKAGGCSGLSYDLSFDNTLNEGDEEQVIDNVKIVIDVRRLWWALGDVGDLFWMTPGCFLNCYLANETHSL